MFSTYLGGQKIAPLANLSEDLTLAARNATLNMIDFLVKTKGLNPRAGLRTGQRGRRSQHRASRRCPERGCYGDLEPRRIQAAIIGRRYEAARIVDIGGGCGGVCARRAQTAVADLEPDRMWSIYRRYHLLIVGQRDDEIASALAGAVVDVLARFLPTSRALLARAADTRRVGVLIATNQQDVAIMAAESAEALFLAKPPFDDIRNAPLRVIASFGSHVLVCRPDFMARHAYLLAQTLAEHKDALPTPASAPRESSRRTEDRTPFSPAKRCPMIDALGHGKRVPHRAIANRHQPAMRSLPGSRAQARSFRSPLFNSWRPHAGRS